MHHNLSTSQCKDIIFVCVIFFVVDSVHSGEAQTCTNGFRENEIHIYPVAFILFIYFIEFFVVVVGFFLKVFGSLFVASRCSHIFVVGNFSCCCFFLAAFKDFFIRWQRLELWFTAAAFDLCRFIIFLSLSLTLFIIINNNIIYT